MWWSLALVMGCGSKVGDTATVTSTSVPATTVGTEICNGVDDDGDGEVDELDDVADATSWYLDGDSDGYGDPNTETVACDPPADHVADGTDCDDGNAAVNPGAYEGCSGVDDDCDGLIDDADPDLDVDQFFYDDDDGDGYGDPATLQSLCEQPKGTVTNGDDCDDTDEAVYPGAPDICDGVATDCDNPQEAGLATFFDAKGVAVDVSAELAAGTAKAPVAWTAPAAGTLGLCAGTWYATITGSEGELWIDGGGLEDTVLDAAGTGTAIDAGSAERIVVHDLSITAGHGTSGGGLSATDADVDLTRVLITGSTADEHGGGVFIDSGTLTMSEVVIEDCDAVDGNGGAVYAIYATVEAQDLSTARTTGVDGGAMWVGVADVTLTDVDMTGATSSDDAGGVLVINTDLTWTGGSVTGCFAGDDGGAMHIHGSDAVLDGLVLEDNEASFWGGVFDLEDSMLTVIRSTLQRNLAVEGGALHVNGADGAVFEDTIITDNTATSEGGGLWFEGVDVTCRKGKDDSSGVYFNHAPVGGGAFVAGGSLESEGCDWGTEGDGDDNDADDVYTIASGTSYVDLGDDVDRVCRPLGCD